MYKDTIAKTPMDPEANRQVGDARMELWDGKDRVNWVTVAKGQSIVEETVAALKDGMTMEPDADFGYFLNADGTLRTTDVWVVGYSWGSQTWGMISSTCASAASSARRGRRREGFPNAHVDHAPVGDARRSQVHAARVQRGLPVYGQARHRAQYRDEHDR